MARYIHTSTARRAIRVIGDALAVDCTVHLIDRHGAEQDINFEVVHERQSPVIQTDVNTLLLEVRARGKELAEAFIAAHAEVEAA